MKTIWLVFYWMFLFGTWCGAGQNQAEQPAGKESITLEWQFQFGEPGAGAGQFKNPVAISSDLTGAVYVCDLNNNRIQKFDKKGKFLRQIGGFGWGREQFHQPMDIHARSALDIFIADYQNQRIERYDRELNFISSLFSKDTWDEKFQFTRPVGIAFSSQRELFILDEENPKVIKINSFGEPEFRFGDFNWGKGQLKKPAQIEIAKDEKIFVSDSEDNIIHVFDYYGNYLFPWGTNELSNPRGLFWDETGFLFVADTGNRRLVIFNQEGELIFTPKIMENTSPKLIEPVDIVFNSPFVYVVDQTCSCIQVYLLQISTQK
ncbi:NHL repeat-containing protein [candidate division KSB1 bacterium]|nr:NHL repeat-containing protein [candidate division KSB1 bacterium]